MPPRRKQRMRLAALLSVVESEAKKQQHRKNAPTIAHSTSPLLSAMTRQK
jgi:hypothetical protein